MPSSASAPVQRRGEENEPDDDREVGSASREQERVGGAHAESGEEHQADREQHPGCRRTRLRHGGHELRLEEADDADHHDRDRDRSLERDHVGDRPLRVQPAHPGEGEHGRADGKRGPAGERDDTVRADEHAGGDEPVDGEQRRHDREAAGHDDGARVAPAGSLGEERDGGCRGDEGTDADPVEVHPERWHHHRLAPQPENDDRHDRQSPEQEQCRFREAATHPVVIDRTPSNLKGARVCA